MFFEKRYDVWELGVFYMLNMYQMVVFGRGLDLNAFQVDVVTVYGVVIEGQVRGPKLEGKILDRETV